jgi:uncharacterized protein with PIN domain
VRDELEKSCPTCLTHLRPIWQLQANAKLEGNLEYAELIERQPWTCPSCGVTYPLTTEPVEGANFLESYIAAEAYNARLADEREAASKKPSGQPLQAKSTCPTCSASYDLPLIDQTGVSGVINQAAFKFRTTGDDKVCERCRAFDGQGADKEKDLPQPPLHPHCRCVVVSQLQASTKDFTAARRRQLGGRASPFILQARSVDPSGDIVQAQALEMSRRMQLHGYEKPLGPPSGR